MARKVKLEVTTYSLGSEEVLISPHRVRSFLVIIALGLPLTFVSILMLIAGFRSVWSIVIFGLCLVLGGVLLYMSLQAFLAPSVLIETENRVIHVGPRGTQFGQTWSFDDLDKPPIDAVLTLGFLLARARLRLGDGRSLLLFVTTDVHRAEEAILGIGAALDYTFPEACDESFV
jgi:hypothetical protein